MNDPNAGYEDMNGRQFGEIMATVMTERARQNTLKQEGRFRYTCADEGMGNSERLACLVEEVGEVAQEVLTQEGRRLARDTEGTKDSLRKELVQVIAVCVAWLESDCNVHARYEEGYDRSLDRS